MLLRDTYHTIMSKQLTQEVLSGIKKLDFTHPKKQNIDRGERVVSLASGTYLLFKSLSNLRKHPFLALQGVATGSLLLYRGATGDCPVYRLIGKDTTDPEAINITEKIVVNVNREKLYDFWRQLSNLPKFMTHLNSVEEFGQKSTWVANTPGNLINLRWNAEITREKKGEYIGWQSVQGSMIDNAGKVEFSDTLNGTGTEITIEINYFPPAGSVGRGLVSLFNGSFERMISEDIRNFKQYAEDENFKRYAGLESDK